MAAMTRAIKRRWPRAWVIKIHGSSYQSAGVPDLLVSVDGLLVGIEAKARRQHESQRHAYERATILQRAEIAKLRRSGATAGVALTVEEALELVDSALVAHSKQRSTLT